MHVPRGHPKGLRSEQIRAKLKLDKKQFQYAADLGKQSDQLIQTGERRTTAYALQKATKQAEAWARKQR